MEISKLCSFEFNELVLLVSTLKFSEKLKLITMQHEIFANNRSRFSHLFISCIIVFFNCTIAGKTSGRVEIVDSNTRQGIKERGQQYFRRQFNPVRQFYIQNYVFFILKIVINFFASPSRDSDRGIRG